MAAFPQRKHFGLNCCPLVSFVTLSLTDRNGQELSCPVGEERRLITTATFSSYIVSFGQASSKYVQPVFRICFSVGIDLFISSSLIFDDGWMGNSCCCCWLTTARREDNVIIIIKLNIGNGISGICLSIMLLLAIFSVNSTHEEVDFRNTNLLPLLHLQSPPLNPG